jgi:hypothetical protein
MGKDLERSQRRNEFYAYLGSDKIKLGDACETCRSKISEVLNVDMLKKLIDTQGSKQLELPTVQLQGDLKHDHD